MIDEITNELLSRIPFLDNKSRLIVSGELSDILSKYKIEKITTEISTQFDNTQYMINQFCIYRKASGLKDETIRNQKMSLYKFFSNVNKAYDKVSNIDIIIFVSKLLQDGMKQTSVQNYYRAINAFYSFLILNDIIEKNPMDKVKKVKEKYSQKYAFSRVEIEKMKENCDKFELALLEFLLSTGCRVNETINVKIQDINFYDKSVNVLVTKNDKPRVCYLSDVAIMRIKNYLDSRKDKCEYLFVTERNPHKIGKRAINKKMKKLSLESGVKNIHPHRFRRTFCTNMLERGMPIQEVSKLMGHSCIQTTMRYADISNSKIKNSFENYI